jgi:hypothetical protein
MKGAKRNGNTQLRRLLFVSLIGLLPTAAKPARAASATINFAGEMSGLVTDASGRPQPGAVVLLFNKQDKLLQRTATSILGTFTFDDLLPDLYNIRVSLASFVPAMKEAVQIRPGMRSLLSVNLSRVFSSVQLVSTTPAPGGLMNDDWKWILRSDNALRPILRLLPVTPRPDPRSDQTQSSASAVFTESRGLVRLSASDGARASGSGEADLGTQFAFATSVYGGNHLQFAGDVGYVAATGSPSAAVRTTYSHDLEGGVSPWIAVTMRQTYIPLRVGQSLWGSPPADGLPALRTLGVSFGDKDKISDALELEYGFEFDSISFLDRLHYFSPYARLTYALPRGSADFTWTAGNPRPELGISASGPTADLQRDLAALAVLPRITLDSGRARVQRNSDYELGLSQRFGSREFRIAGYHEFVSNTALMIASPSAGLFPGDLLPDMFSNSGLFNLGNFQTFGYTTSAAQDLGSNYKVTLIYGSLGVLSPRNDGVPVETAGDLRRDLASSHRSSFTLRVSGTAKTTGTRFVASYQWTDYRSAMPGPSFSAQAGHPEPGLNVTIRQPIPAFPGMPGRIEASAELRNLLAQGYLPLLAAGDQQLLLINTPRSFRGGLAFVF